MKHYVDSNGVYLYGTDGEAPEGGIDVEPQPEYADQIWLFPGWGPSIFKATQIEDQWREEQMTRVVNQLLMLEDEDPNAKPGTARQWRDYRIELRKWTAENPDFPDSSKRPVAPG
nr:hypothetical protein [uncultured Pseudomonas sp.]